MRSEFSFLPQAVPSYPVKEEGNMFKLRAAVIARIAITSSLMLVYGALATAARSFDSLISDRAVAVQNLTSERAQQENSSTLEPGKPIERPMAGGQTHRYTISLKAGQYLQLLVDQRGIDVALSLLAPDGQKLAEMDSPNSTQGPELVSILAEQSGNYRIEIISSRKTIPAGRYEVKIVAIRNANELDKKRLQAQKAYLEGRQLQRQGTAESRQKAIQKYEESAQNWRLAGESVMEVHTLSLSALAHRQLGQLQKALQLYNEALQIAQSLNDRREEAATLGGIALIYSDMGKPQQARE
jgi:tetratricopeptide (TPR) repeat protein